MLRLNDQMQRLHDQIRRFNDQMTQKGPNGDQRLPYAPVFWNWNPIRRGQRTGACGVGDRFGPHRALLTLRSGRAGAHWERFYTAQHWLQPGSGRIYRLPPLPPTPLIHVPLDCVVPCCCRVVTSRRFVLFLCFCVLSF